MWQPYWHDARGYAVGQAAHPPVSSLSTLWPWRRRRALRSEFHGDAVDGEGKVRGSTRYAADVPVHGLLHARLVLAAEAHGRIARIDGDGGARRRGGRRGAHRGRPALRRRRRRARRAAAGARGGRLLRPALVELVVAESEAAAADGVDEVIVEIEPLEAVLDLETAMAPGAASARIDVDAGQRRRRRRCPRGGGRGRRGR